MIYTKAQFLDINGLTEFVKYLKTCINNFDEILYYASFTLFPESGKEDVVYIDTSTGIFYRWNVSSKEYIALSQNVKYATSAGNALMSTNVSGSVSITDSERHIWFSDSEIETKRSYDDKLKYNPANNTITTNISGTAAIANSVPWTGVTGKPSSMPASDVYSWAKAASKPSYTKSEVGLGNVDNTADSAKSVKYATSAGSATKDSANQQINTTYIKGLSVSGRTITYTKGDNTTGTITTQDTNTTYNAATSLADGLMSASDKIKLDDIAAGANKYVHPTYTAKSNGLYKVTVDSTGHVSATTAVTKADITALGIPGQDTNTTYSTGTSSTSGLAKLYTGTGSATDGTMTQNAITTALNGKSATGHTHAYAGSSSAGGAADSAIKLNTARNITIGNSTKSFDGTTNLSWSLNEIGIPTKSDIAACAVMYGGATLSSSATVTDSAAQYKVISRSIGSTGDIFTKSATLPKGLYSVMIRMKVSTISSSSNVFKLTIVDGSTTTTKYIKPNMFKAEDSYTTLGTAVENTSGTLKITLNVYSTLSNQTVCVDYLAIAPTMVGVTSIA